jgi:hypothetical protein
LVASFGISGLDGKTFLNKEKEFTWEVVHPSGVEPETF